VRFLFFELWSILFSELIEKRPILSTKTAISQKPSEEGGRGSAYPYLGQDLSISIIIRVEPVHDDSVVLRVPGDVVARLLDALVHRSLGRCEAFGVLHAETLQLFKL